MLTLLGVGGSVGTSALTSLDGLGATGAWSMGRNLLSAWGASARYTTATGIDSFQDQTGNARHFAQSTAGNQPAVTTAGPNSRACADLDGIDDSFTGASLITLLSVSAGYAVMSFLADTITLNNATVYQNHCLISDTSAFWGLFLKNAGAPKTVLAYNFDTNVDVASDATISATTAYVVEWRHEGGNLYIRVNGGTWSAPTASGDTGTLTNNSVIGVRAGAGFYDGKIFEVATWSTVPTAGNQDAIAALFKSWVGA